jgi:hypothetical protein
MARSPCRPDIRLAIDTHQVVLDHAGAVPVLQRLRLVALRRVKKYLLQVF